MKILGFLINAYNSNITLLKECLDSFSNLKHHDEIEVLIVDNGSTNEEVWNLILDFNKQHNFNIHRIENNEGKKNSILYGINNLNTKYMQIFNHDDILNIDNIERLIHMLKTEEPDVILLNYDYFNNIKNKITQTRKVIFGRKEYKLVKKLKKRQWHFDINTIYNIQILKQTNFNFPKNISMYEDVYINNFMFNNSKKIALFNRTIYTYRIKLEDQLSSTKSLLNNYKKYLEMVLELSKVINKNKATAKNSNYIFSLNYFSFSYFNSISIEDKIIIKERFNKLKYNIKNNKTIKYNFIMFFSDLLTNRRKRTYLRKINELVLKVRK